MGRDGWIARFCPAGVIRGHVIFSMGHSYQACEVEPLGASLSGPEADRTLFEELCAILMQAFHEVAFSHHGKHYMLAPDGPPGLVRHVGVNLIEETDPDEDDH
jgi:hypothetical protein